MPWMRCASARRMAAAAPLEWPTTTAPSSSRAPPARRSTMKGSHLASRAQMGSGMSCILMSTRCFWSSRASQPYQFASQMEPPPLPGTMITRRAPEARPRPGVRVAARSASSSRSSSAVQCVQKRPCSVPRSTSWRKPSKCRPSLGLQPHSAQRTANSSDLAAALPRKPTNSSRAPNSATFSRPLPSASSALKTSATRPSPAAVGSGGSLAGTAAPSRGSTVSQASRCSRSARRASTRLAALQVKPRGLRRQRVAKTVAAARYVPLAFGCSPSSA
mmetsp:Transcript_59868/g.165639  ORF Transcript_59868/g.165639 Transcript_59868/m.165639 type:complete len:275 (-) Transcript_59868:528-1352(-)